MAARVLRRPAAYAETPRTWKKPEQFETPTPVRAGVRLRKEASAKRLREHGDADRLPVMLVTGFLGAGKTTVVNSLLKRRGSLRVAVFVNEFGQIDVDGEVLRTCGGIERNRVLSLKDGCMCCGGKDDFEIVLREEFTCAQKELDYLIIETSGISDPRPVLATLKDIPGISVDRVVCVVDATTLDNASFGACDAAQPQIASAHILVLSKMDLLDDTLQETEKIEKALFAKHQAASRSVGFASSRPAMFRSTHENLDLKALRSVNVSRNYASKRRRITTLAADLSLHENLNTLSIVTPSDFNRKRFEAWAAALPTGLVRAKGLIHVKGERHQLVWHWAGGRGGSLEKVDCHDRHCSAADARNNFRGCEVVLIGRYGDKSFKPVELERSLRGCIVGRK